MADSKSKKDINVSLAPLSFGEALDALLKVKPDEDPPEAGKKRPKRDELQQPDD